MSSDVIGNATAADESRISIIGAANRAAAVVRSAPDASARVPGLDWTLAETAVHLATETREYARLLTGEIDIDESLQFAARASGPGERSAILNARQLDRTRELDPGRLADAIESAADMFVSAAGTRQPNETIRVTNGLSMAAEKVSKVILGEQVIHGYDISRAAKARWDISRSDALKVIDGVVSLVPEYVDPDATRSVELSYELRLRGGPSYRIDFDHGTARVGLPGGKVDCKLIADPVAFLLVGYHRTGQWGQILRRKVVATGAKPWLGMRFGQLLTSA